MPARVEFDPFLPEIHSDPYPTYHQMSPSGRCSSATPPSGWRESRA